MRYIGRIFFHYSATYETMDIGVVEIAAMHRARGWSREGYHEIIRIGGERERGRPWAMAGAGVLNHNRDSLHICCIGGLRKGVKGGVDTRTQKQIETQVKITEEMLRLFPGAKVLGHNEVAATECPGYKGSEWWYSGRSLGITPQPHTQTVTRGYLQKGKHGGEVKRLKQALKNLGFHPAEITSDWFGQYTEDRVKEFQQAMLEAGNAEVIVDGKVGPVTWAFIIRQGGLNGVI